MKKIFFSLFAGLVLCAGVFAATTQEIRLGVLNGPSCIPAGYLLDDAAPVKGAKISYEKCSIRSEKPSGAALLLS